MLTSIWTYFESWYRSEDGAAMVEYGLLVALIAVIVAVALTPLGTAIHNMFDGVTGSL